MASPEEHSQGLTTRRRSHGGSPRISGLQAGEVQIKEKTYTRWQIIISEASPTAWHLQTYIAEALTTQGYSNVDVIMEW